METILAREPTSEGKAPIKKLSKDKAKPRFNQLISEREQYLERWKSIRDYQLPYLGCFDGEQQNQSKRRDQKILTGTAWEADQVFAAGVMSGLTPPSRQWFKLAFRNKELAENIQAAQVLDIRQEILYAILARSNFYNAIHCCYQELPFGQAPLGIFPSYETVVHFLPFPIGTYSLAVGANGVVNAFGYKYEMTPAQLVEQFGIENVSELVKESIRNNKQYSDKVAICMLVEPNTDYSSDSVSNAKMPYRIMYWEEKQNDKEWLSVCGAKEFPVPVARYLVNGLETYGKGAGWFAEPDAKMLQVLRKDYLSGTQLKVRPPMQADSETVMKGVNLIPGAANGLMNNQGQGIRPVYQTDIDLSELREEIKETKDAIRRAYAADLFLLLDQIEKGQMTAREVMERSQEKLQQLAPVVERLQFEFLNPILERVYNIAERSGVFPPFPQEAMEILQDEELQIEYTSPLAQAQKLGGLVSIEQAMTFVASIAQMYPEAIDKINAIEAVDKYMDILGAPAAIRRSDDEVAEIQAQRQKAAQQQEQQAALMAAAQPAKDYTQAAANLHDVTGSGASNTMSSILGIGGM